MTLPPGPVPATRERSTFPSLAIALALGLARTWPEGCVRGACEEEDMGAAAFAAGLAFSFFASWGGAGAEGASWSPSFASISGVTSLNAPMSSSSSQTMATGLPISMSDVPACTSTLARKPPSTASHSMVALSVSTSARISPASIASPSFFDQEDRLPWVMVGESEGMPSTVCGGRARARDEGAADEGEEVDWEGSSSWAGCSDAAAGEYDSNFPTSPSSSHSTATSVPTGTSLAPSCKKILAR
mmetsp:Transcript_3543/g.9977  ORF Transcript_3543/g.9977 Transcript_3543/m.9977 type:complete len:244 (+) Transcript_3543:401-1132(+)